MLCLALGTLVAGCAHWPDPAAAAAPRIDVMTYNIRLDLASDGDNSWSHRKDLVAQLIRHEAPDIFGTQEVLLNQRRDLEQALPGYTFVGVGRDDGAEAGEASPLAWRSERYEALASDTFWLSETPSRPGKGWDAAYPRIATWAILKDRRSGVELRVLNTHFDHVGQVARRNAARQILDWVENGPGAGLPTVVFGDFNSTVDSEPYRILSAGGLIDSRDATRAPPYGPRGTFNGWRIDSDADSPIDHIFVSSAVVVSRYAVITQHWGGRLPSDHYPVMAELEIPR